MKKADVKLMMAKRGDHLRDIGLDPMELNHWRKNWQNLKDRAKRIGRQCDLSFEQYTNMAVEAGIKKADEVGLKPGNFQVGRNQDQGDYVFGNCRFIPKEQNLKERWMYAKGKE